MTNLKWYAVRKYDGEVIVCLRALGPVDAIQHARLEGYIWSDISARAEEVR